MRLAQGRSKERDSEMVGYGSKDSCLLTHLGTCMRTTEENIICRQVTCEAQLFGFARPKTIDESVWQSAICETKRGRIPTKGLPSWFLPSSFQRDHQFTLIPTSHDPVSRPPVAVFGSPEDLCDVMRTSLFVGWDCCDTFAFPYRGSSQLNLCLSGF